MDEFLSREFYGNSVMVYITAAAIFISGIIAIRIFRLIILKRFKKWAERSETKIDDYIINGVEKAIVPLLYFGAFYLALNSLSLHPKVYKALNAFSVIILTFFTIRVILAILKHSLNSYLDKKGLGENKEKQIKGIVTLGSLLIWTLGLVFILDNLGFEISAVIAGLGIGGIAIALAAQTILGDLFSYFVIFFDRPFQIGDFITLAPDKMGSIEYIGIKTTRLRSLGGEQLIVSNTDLVNSRIHNYKRMERRRVLFKFGVVYDTPADKIAEISSLVKDIITGTENTDFDRAHFFAYGDFSLVYEVVYYVMSPDYNVYMDIQQDINLKMFKEFSARGIHFAFPTRTIYLNQVDGAEEPETKIV